MREKNKDFIKFLIAAFVSVIIRRVFAGFSFSNIIPDITLITLAFIILSNKNSFFKIQLLAFSLGIVEDILSIVPMGFWGTIRLTECILLQVFSDFIETSYVSFSIGFIVLYILHFFVLFWLGELVGVSVDFPLFQNILNIFFSLTLIPLIRYLFVKLKLIDGSKWV
ncbi:hypothetical protein WKV44_04190 [Spirochaetia bacterium 38H-sp]|uniref:Rod shape-determining protein MreD n=1 Tax=Rarispira pelagica TaxID=3141764 RepID=A0ABU9UAQ2_9SPIR